MFDICAFITFHSEGSLAKNSVASFRACVDTAKQAGLDVDAVYCIDNGDQATRDALHSSDISNEDLVSLSFGDQGKVRNHLVSTTTSKYTAFLDGDDLWSQNWLVEAYTALEAEPNCRLVAHPEFNIFFEGSTNALQLPDQRTDGINAAQMRSANPWDALCFCRTSIFQQVSYPSRDIENGFAFEDWVWSRKTFEAGIHHHTIPNTIIFKRRRAGSQGEGANKRGVLTSPSESTYFDFSDHFEL